jgi:defect-in-organelle-trafficking protein DotC
MYAKILIRTGLVSAIIFALPAYAQSVSSAAKDAVSTGTGIVSDEAGTALSAAARSTLSDTQENIQAQSDAATITENARRQALQVYNPEKIPVIAPGAVEPETPPSLEQLQSIKKENAVKQDDGMRFDIRKDAIREAAVSFGARGGLAWRTWHIRQELNQRSRSLDKIFDFRQLLIPAPSGLLIEPPVISETINGLLIQDGGQQAAVSDRVYNIINNAKIVSSARTWHTYLEREWGAIDPPPDILRPENEEERQVWVELVSKGWEEGVAQADEIFEDDLNVLMADFQGMVRYRALLAQGMVSPPYALQVDRGVTGGKDEMRIGDRAVQITGVPELITGSQAWQPGNR